MTICFERKTNGRIWTVTEDDVRMVHQVIKGIDEFEYSYMPENFVSVYKGDLHDTIYGHKFELDINTILQACWSQGVPVVCITGER